MQSIKPPRRGLGPVITTLAFLFAVGCSGDGCSCLAPIPGGFPAEERTPNAAQVRVSSTGIEAITSDPAALIEALTGGPLTFDVPASCDGTPTTCCPGGNPVSPCGPIEVDLALHPGDEPRLVVTPAQGASRIDVTMRARVRTVMDVPVGILGADCGLAIDTEPGTDPDIRVDLQVNLTQDPTTGTTRVEVGDVTLSQLDAEDDVSINGGFTCALADFGLSFFIGTLEDTFTNAIRDAITEQTCKSCPSGDVAECGEFATACTDNVCMIGDRCMQELGVSGRLAGGAVFGGFSPGTTGAIDLYEVAGGYATTDAGGVALGLLGGMLPAGAARDRCGPPATPPAPVTIPQSAFFQGNTRPDTGEPFDVAIGVHQNQLDRFAYSAYDGGLLCLTVTTATVDLLTSDTIGLFIPSMSNLTSTTAPMAIGLRPQSPPTIALGPNTFIDDGNGNTSLETPLLDITFQAMELDFFMAIEDQYVRLFTLVADVHLPVGLEVGAGGELTPVLGDLEGAFSNVSVKNSDPLLESPEELAETFPLLLDLALPQLAGALGAIEVPELGGLSIQITDITSVDDDAFLAIFGELAPATMAGPPVDTEAAIAGVRIPDTADFADASRWRHAARPAIDLTLGGSDRDLEWSVRVDGGLWSPWSRAARRTVSPRSLWLQGRHRIEVRARRAGDPASVDPTPVVLEQLIDTVAPAVVVDEVAGGVRIAARDNVTRGLPLRWRLDGGAWTDAAAPVTIPLWGRDPRGLELEVADEAGNVTVVKNPATLGARADAPAPAAPAVAAGPAPAPVDPGAGFHGQAGEAGCSCATTSGAPSGGALVLVGVVGLALTRRRRRRALARAALVLLVAGMIPACDCGGSPPCGGQECMPGEVEMGAVGRWNGVASDGARTVVSTYDQGLGDLVLVDVVDGGDPVYTAVDGIPDEPPAYDPGTYRGGVPNPGPDVGAWTSVALHDGLARIAYQDREARALRLALEHADGAFTTHVVDAAEGEEIGLYTSIAVVDGRPAIAYLATGIDDGAGGRKTELRLARASIDEPTDASAWQIAAIAEAPASCAGRCAAGQACVESAGAEVCTADTGDCASPCADDEVCVAGACVAEIPEPTVADLPRGTGLFATLLVMPDGRLAIVHYDRARTALVAHVETGAGSSTFSEVILDGADGADRGMWASAVVDAGGTIHVGYQDALGDQVFYTTLATAAGTPELVDDGVREGDRTHPVGAGATVVLDGGAPAIVYQDGLTADLVIATRDGGGAWTRADFATGPLIDGFHLAATPDGRWIVWDSLDKTRTPATGLEIRAR